MSLTSRGEELILALNKKLIVLQPQTPKITKSLEISPEITPEVDTYPIGPEASENPNGPAAKPEPLKGIQHIKVSPSGEYLAVTTTGNKLLLLYKILPGSLELLSVRRITRASSALAFASDSKSLLLSDKTGDCYSFDCIESKTPGKWLFGHLSMVLDVRFAPERNGILTADRDEKVRITNFPATHEIEGFCLGHTEYVSCINLLPTNTKEVVVSLSGDKTLRVWNYRTGKELHQVAIPAPGIKFVSRQVEAAVSHVAVVVFQPDESTFLYRLQQSGDTFECSLISSHSFQGQIVTDLEFCGDDLYLTTSTDGRLGLQCLRHENGAYTAQDTKPLDDALGPAFHQETITELLDVSGWFKKKFDNVTEYMERKKRRIDEKINKNNAIQCN